jgi:hypothetical protein
MESLSTTLAELHSRYQVYAESQVNGDVEPNIIQDLRTIEGLEYMAAFYDEYVQTYLESSNFDSSPFLKGAARSTDLPFIGRRVCESGHAKYMFVFEGSLQETTCLSMTVLSCFWIFTDIEPLQGTMTKYWRRLKRYQRIIDDLGITPAIAEQSYVVDAFRIPNHRGTRDTKQNRALLQEEIRVLDPEIIVLVGNTAKDVAATLVVGESSRFHHVPFPADRVPTITRQVAPEMYKRLRERLQALEI